MTKTELEALEQKTMSAQKALKESVEEYKKSRNPETASPDGIKPEEWKSQVSEKYQKAKKDFAEYSTKLAGARAETQDALIDEELADEEAAMARWERDNLQTPTGRHQRDPSEASATGPSQKYRTKLEHDAADMARFSGPRPDQATRNMIAMLKGEAKTYYRRVNGKVIDVTLTPSQHELYNEAFSMYVAYGSEDTRTQTARQKLSAAIPSEKYALLTSGGDTGGFLVPEDFHAEVIKDLVGMSVFRQLCRVIQTGRDVAVFPSVNAGTDANADLGYTSGFAGSYKSQRSMAGGGTALTVQNQPRFGQERIQIHRWEPDAIEVPLEFVEDPGVDAMGVLAEVIAETKAMDEIASFTNGTGTGEPEGILSTGANIRTKSAGASATFTYSGLLDCWADLAAQYRQNATWMMNSPSYATILGLSDTDGMPIFSPNSLPGTLWGRPVAFNEHMPDVAAGAKPAIFGDFRHYVIADRMELRVMRLMERMAPNQGLLPIARLGGQVTRRNAFRAAVTTT
ncbi:MAG: phage major capsid protein [Gemmatimonadales bacterium]|nr:MAG: phage major capsid protein [Gemmatimonadales bacterium]